MEPREICIRFLISVAYISILATTFFILTADARPSKQFSSRGYKVISKAVINKHMKKPKLSSHIINAHRKLYDSETEPDGLSSPFSLPPFESLAPVPFPDYIPAPYSVYLPPLTPHIKSPPLGPPPHTVASPPIISPSASPPNGAASPSLPHYEPSPPKFFPNPPVYQPPGAIHPPPLEPPPPPPHKNPQFTVWCVAKPTVPDSIIQEAMDYACGMGADCKPIQPNGPCFQPNTLFAHASYAFNGYWQKSKGAGGTCDFGGTAMLVTVDPSYDDCQFIYD